MSNLKQTGMALIMYADDYDGWTPRPYTYPYNGVEASWSYILKYTGYIPNYKACICPSQPLIRTSNFCLEGYGIRAYLGKGKGFKILSLKNPSGTVVLADTIAYHAGAYNTWLQYSEFADIKPATDTAKSIHLRHAGMANCWFADGHVESLDGAGLKALPAAEIDYKTKITGGRTKDYTAVDF